jgi:ubiquitin-conjugating enzyme E2 Z
MSNSAETSTSAENKSLTSKRLLKDIIDIYKHPLTEHGIYYKHDDTDTTIGHGMIIGPSNSPYEHGFFFFKFEFPNNYPLGPPRLVFLTNDGRTRFNPNLYRNGKVCLSILNTWSGPGWSACQTIRTILLSLITLFHNNPLVNEPGIPATHRDATPYNNIIRHQTFSTSIYNILTLKINNPTTKNFEKEFNQYFRNNYSKILLILNTENDKFKHKAHCFKISLYDMKTVIDYNVLIAKFKDPDFLKTIKIQL